MSYYYRYYFHIKFYFTVSYVNYDYVKIYFNMSIKIQQTFSGSYNFTKIKQNKTLNVYFQEPSSICESEFKAYRLPYNRLDSLKSALDTSSISRTYPGTFMHTEGTSVFECWNWNSMVDDDVEREHKIAEECILRNGQRLQSDSEINIF